MIGEGVCVWGDNFINTHKPDPYVSDARTASCYGLDFHSKYMEQFKLWYYKEDQRRSEKGTFRVKRNYNQITPGHAAIQKSYLWVIEILFGNTYAQIKTFYLKLLIVYVKTSRSTKAVFCLYSQRAQLRTNIRVYVQRMNRKIIQPLNINEKVVLMSVWEFWKFVSGR